MDKIEANQEQSQGANPALGALAWPPRLRRERRTIEAMIGIYCRAHHSGTTAPCTECQDLLEYATQRLSKCPFGEAKPACIHCPVHCYRANYRDRVRQVMRFAGPRMLLRHPILAIRHLLDERRPAPARAKNLTK